MQGFPFDSYVTYDAETGQPIYDRGVSSKPLRNLIKELFTTGVMPNPSDNLQTFAGTDGMTVVVHPGFAVIEGGLCMEENSRTLAITAADPEFDRIDSIVVRWNENDSVRTADLHVVQGTPSRNPVRPTLNREGSIYEIGIADVFVTHGVVTITNEKITDTRMEAERCGIVSSVSEWDTTTIYQQIQSELANFKSNEEAEFVEWFDYMKDQLTEDAAGRLQTEVDEVRAKTHTNLLNPTLQTTTINGITCTNNGDGTYTLNGTASANTYFNFTPWATPASSNWNKINKGTYRFVGHKPNTTSRLSLQVTDTSGTVYHSDETFEIPNDNTPYKIYLYIESGKSFDNVTFKPMLTTDLSADYDSFVRYSGDGELNQNVAEIYKEVEDHETRLDSAETTIGNHTDEITQIRTDLSDKIEIEIMTASLVTTGGWYIDYFNANIPINAVPVITWCSGNAPMYFYYSNENKWGIRCQDAGITFSCRFIVFK